MVYSQTRQLIISGIIVFTSLSQTEEVYLKLCLVNVEFDL